MIKEAFKRNCWEHQNCGRQEGGINVDRLGLCSAASHQCANGINDGKNGGRTCWAVAGMFSDGKIECSCQPSTFGCILCDFYSQVENEQGEDFVFLHPIINTDF